jgi:hypothetical protein
MNVTGIVYEVQRGMRRFAATRSVAILSHSAMSKVFISYSRDSGAIARTLADHVQELGHSVWFDKNLTGGEDWWERILSNIRDCAVFILVLHPEALESQACSAEYGYADDLGKPILPVLVSDEVSMNRLPAALSRIQFVDYRKQDVAAVFALARALSSIPQPPPLPDPLPSPPKAPISPLVNIGEMVEASRELSPAEQTQVLADLRKCLQDPKSAEDARDLLHKLKRRDEVRRTVTEEIEMLLAGTTATRAKPRLPRPRLTVGRLLIALALVSLVPLTWWAVGQFGGSGPVRYLAADGLPAGSGAMRLTAVLASGDDSGVESVKWTIYDAKAEPPVSGTEVTRGYDSEQRFILPAERYLVSVQAGAASAQQQIVVKAGMVATATLVLNAGIVKLTAVLAKGRPRVDTLKWSILESKTDGFGNRKEITRGYEAEQYFVLPEGAYILNVEAGATSIEQDLTIKAGARTPMEVALNAGILELQGRFNGSAVQEIKWTVSEIPDALGKAKEVKTGYEPVQSFILPAGRYLVSGQAEGASAKRQIEIEAGRQARATLHLTK